MFICFFFSAKAQALSTQKNRPTRYEFENESGMNRGVSLINAWPWNEVRLAMAKKKEKKELCFLQRAAALLCQIVKSRQK